jgi:hypothetical protein
MKKDEKVIYHCSQAVDDDALDELIRDLTETALASGGFVAYFGPDDEGDGAGQATPPGHRPVPRCPDPDWWPPST